MKTVALTKGQVALVDDNDLELVMKFRWNALVKPGRICAYKARSAACTYIYMHRLIMRAGPDQHVDHINGNALDNRKSNLRLCTNAENIRNGRLRKNNSSGYKGVYWCAAREKWASEIKFERKKIYLGRFDSLEAAARAYDEAARKLYGEFARLNFPD